MILAKQKTDLQRKLIGWFKRNRRDLPWRRSHDPYAIWVSEVMLQQNRVATVIPYYGRFLRSFPTVRHLARADLARVLRIWEGLGYYSRARNLHQAAQMIVGQFRGRIPESLDGLLHLPGIGRSTAGAILSIAYNKDFPILDGNVRRVLSRLFAISEDPKKSERALWQISKSLLPRGRAGAFNQALMELGATVCTPRAPECARCPLENLCRSRAEGNPEEYPKKSHRKSLPQVTAVAAIITRRDKVLMVKRPPEGLLGGLWEFPNWKIEEEAMRAGLRNTIWNEMAMRVEVKEPIGTYQQTFSHFKLTLHVFRCETKDEKRKGKWVLIKHLDQFPMSRLHRRIARSMSLHHGGDVVD